MLLNIPNFVSNINKFKADLIEMSKNNANKNSNVETETIDANQIGMSYWNKKI